MMIMAGVARSQFCGSNRGPGETLHTKRAKVITQSKVGFEPFLKVVVLTIVDIVRTEVNFSSFSR